MDNTELKQNERMQNRENVTEKQIYLGRSFKLATSDKIYVNSLNLHESENEVLLHYTGDFENIGSMLIGEARQKTTIRVRNIDDLKIIIIML